MMNKSSVIGKILIRGDLILNSPLLIGDGAGETSENFRDIHVLKNQNEKPFIPGTSLCGVLREYMTDINFEMVQKIFGDENKFQSSIQIEDIELENGKIISRDGVKIDGYTGTGIDGGKYDYEAVERGAEGKLKFLINLRGCHIDDENFDEKNYTLEKITTTVANIMKKLEDGIRLGALTSKGFGLVSAKNIFAELFDFRYKKMLPLGLQKNLRRKKFCPLPKNFLQVPMILLLTRILNLIRRL